MRTAVVTGPSVGGIGHHTALELARRGDRVVLAGRNPARLDAAAAAIRAEVPAARLERLVVDLADLTSVRAAAHAASGLGPIDLLVNNAGVMGVRHARTADGLDRQEATNHFGPFLLTGLLLPQLATAADARVVTVSSVYAWYGGRGLVRDPTRRLRRPYRTWRTYGRTKLANLLLTTELDRRCHAAGLPVRALSAHPGLAGTHLVGNGQRSRLLRPTASVIDLFFRVAGQPAAMGAWPTLMAASADLPGGTLVGPDGVLAGTPQVATGPRRSRDEDAARRLWELSERATGIRYP